MERGARQGGSLSPFLFLIVMEGLSVTLKTAFNKGIFKGVQLPNNGPTISHLLYADDTLFIGEWSERNIKNLVRILRCFHISSGLKMNFNNSKVFGVGSTLDEIAC